MPSNRESFCNKQWLRSLITTTLFCLAITAFTLTMWGGSLAIHIVISLGFGYSSVFSARALAILFPTLSVIRNTLLSVLIALGAGTLNAHYWLEVSYSQYKAGDGLLSVFILGVLFTGGCFIYFYAYEQKLRAEAELEKSRRKESEAGQALLLSQLNQLQSQIEPHFLFNTLANINALIETDSSKAQQMLSQLTDLLRATLRSSRKQLTSIHHEIAMISAYLGIQQVRLGDRLTYHIECSEAVKLVEIPPLLIQPLVENAVTHGIEPQTQGGEVTLSLSQDTDNLMITVADNGAGLPGAGLPGAGLPGAGLASTSQNGGHGMALENIRSRLSKLFSSQAVLSLSQRKDGGVQARITIPLMELRQLKEQSNG
jgi:sensor histidine kinase YesM